MEVPGSFHEVPYRGGFMEFPSSFLKRSMFHEGSIFHEAPWRIHGVCIEFHGGSIAEVYLKVPSILPAPRKQSVKNVKISPQSHKEDETLKSDNKIVRHCFYRDDMIGRKMLREACPTPPVIIARTDIRKMATFFIRLGAREKIVVFS